MRKLFRREVVGAFRASDIAKVDPLEASRIGAVDEPASSPLDAEVAELIDRSGKGSGPCTCLQRSPGIPGWRRIRLCDTLHERCTIDDALWAAMLEAFSENAILELLTLAGFFRTVSYLTNGLQLPLETGCARFPVKHA